MLTSLAPPLFETDRSVLEIELDELALILFFRLCDEERDERDEPGVELLVLNWILAYVKSASFKAFDMKFYYKITRLNTNLIKQKTERLLQSGILHWNFNELLYLLIIKLFQLA